MLALAGCGGARRVDGRAVFRGSCSQCHTLIGRDTQVPGGDLAMTVLGVPDIESFVRVMPVHLTKAEIEAVAAYVHAVEAHRLK